MKKGKLIRIINGREVTKFFGLLHNQFKCAEQMFYEGNPDIEMTVKASGNDVVYEIVNKRLQQKYLG